MNTLLYDTIVWILDTYEDARTRAAAAWTAWLHPGVEVLERGDVARVWTTRHRVPYAVYFAIDRPRLVSGLGNHVVIDETPLLPPPLPGLRLRLPPRAFGGKSATVLDPLEDDALTVDVDTPLP